MRALLVVPILAACASDPKTIELAVPGAPALFEGKVADRPWQVFSGKYDGTSTMYSLVLDGEFELLLVTSCGRAMELFGTSDDADVSIGSWQIEGCPSAMGDLVTVTGTMIDTAQLALDGSGAHHNLNGFGNSYPFTLDTSAGAHDLVLWNDTSLEIVHDVLLQDGTDLGAVSLDARASPISVVEIDIPVDPDEDVSTLVHLVTRNGTDLQWSQAPEHVYLMPSEQLAPGDTETLVYSAWANRSARIAVETGFVGLPGDFELLPRIGSVTGVKDALSVIWTPFDEYFTSVTAENFGLTKLVTMSKLWLERHPGPIAFDELAPGLDPTAAATSASTFLVTRQELNATVTSLTSSIAY